MAARCRSRAARRRSCEHQRNSGLRRSRQRPHDLEPRRRHRPERRRRRHRHRRGQRRQRRRDLHRHRQRHPRPLRPHQPGTLLPRHRHHRKPRRQHANGGDDTFTGRQRPRRRSSTSPSTAATGNDTITGGDGNDLLSAATATTPSSAAAATTRCSIGAGDDTFVWNPGDGSDTVEGQDGHDTMVFNGANINENIDLSANGEPGPLHPRRRQHHHGPERRRGGRLQRPGRRRHHHRPRPAGTGVTAGQPRPRGPPAAAPATAQADTVIVNGTNHADNIQITGAGTSYRGRRPAGRRQRQRLRRCERHA